MSLPIVTLPTDEHWDCHQCGICCRGSLVPLSAEDLARLRSQRWEDHPDFRGTPIIASNGLRGGYRLNQRADGSCVFLNEQGLCRIHAELGFEAKPTICRVFPLQLVPQEKQVVLTLRRACPSSAVDRGQDLAGHLPFMRTLVAEDRLKAEEVSPPQLKPGEFRDWKAARLVLAALARLLQDERYPPVRRIVHALQFAALLERAQTAAMDHARFAALVGVLENVCVDEAAPFFADRKPPSAAAGILFRLLALDYLRLHPGYRAQHRWFERAHLAGVAWRTMRGVGNLPQLHPDFPQATFAQLEEPAQIDPAVYKPLSRMIETAAASYVYALANRGDWTIIDSLRALAVTFPVALWLLRWTSVGRIATIDDMVNIVVSLDRGQGYASLTSWQHRWRLRMLARLGALEPLVAWYAR